MKDITKKYLEAVKQDEERYCAQTQQLRELFSREALIYNKPEVKFLGVPKFYDNETIADFERIAETSYAIFDRVINEYINNADYRELFGFEPELEKMILAESGYDVNLPIARIDMFYNEDTREFKFCEFNTDGTSAMKEEFDITECLSSTSVYRKFAAQYELSRFDILENIADNILDVYQKSAYRVERPIIAISDYIEDATVQEFLAIKRVFETRGYEVVVSDIRQLTYKNNYLYYGDKRIDLLYRRAVTSDIIKNLDKSQDFMQAVLNGHTCIVGHLRTQTVHNKKIFIILNQPQTLDILTPEQRDFVKEHIPFTTYLKNGNYNYNDVLLNKDKWVAKPTDMYGAKDVFVGCELSDAEWKDALEFAAKNDYILQEYCALYKTLNCACDENNAFTEGKFGNLTGLYVFSGKLAGVLSRLSSTGIVSSAHGSYSASSIKINI